MKSFTIAGLFAVAVAALSTPAVAGPPDITSTGCVKNFRVGMTNYYNCFTPIYPYAVGHYASLKCADPYKGLRYVTVGKKSVLRCTPN